jgi:probable rRNA maturation factor
MLGKDGNSKIQFSFRHKGLSLTNRVLLKAFIASIIKKERRRLGTLQFIFCSDDDLLSINQEFLGHDYYTDIITFELGDETFIKGEIYISIDRVRENAQTFQQPLYLELHRVIFHGVLHLCGYGDKTKTELTLMRKKETECLTSYFA